MYESVKLFSRAVKSYISAVDRHLISFPMKTHRICHNARHPVPPSFSLICSPTLLLLISSSLSFFLFLTLPLSRSLALINSTGLPSDAFHVPSSYHRLRRGRRPEGYWLNRPKLGEKRELSSLKIKTLLPPWVVNRECGKGLWSSEGQKLVYLLDRDDRNTAVFTERWWGKRVLLKFVDLNVVFRLKKRAAVPLLSVWSYCTTRGIIEEELRCCGAQNIFLKFTNHNQIKDLKSLMPPNTSLYVL